MNTHVGVHPYHFRHFSGCSSSQRRIRPSKASRLSPGSTGNAVTAARLSVTYQLSVPTGAPPPVAAWRRGSPRSTS